METPRKIEDYQALIENKVQESVHLDYKRSAALTDGKKEISKDVSAFANADGGILIYGICEEGHLPVAIDDGIDNSKFNREQLEHLIKSNISPIIEGIEIVQILQKNTTSLYCVVIPKSRRAPHQDCKSKRYFKRYNFESAPMEDYEIQDIRSRVKGSPNPLRVGVDINNGFIFHFVVENIGDTIVENIEFLNPESIPWRNDEKTPQQISNGITYIYPGQKLEFFLESSIELFGKRERDDLRFEVPVRYRVTYLNEPIEDVFPFDLEDLRGSAVISSEYVRESKKLQEKVDRLTKEVAEVGKFLKTISSLASPTGLALSYSAKKFLSGLVTGNPEIPKIPVNRFLDEKVFAEVLEVDIQTAYTISRHFWDSNSVAGLSDREGIDSELVELIRERFKVEEE